MSYPFQSTGSYTGSISSGSYFNESDNELFYRPSTRDFWFGFSPFDVTQIALYDFENNQLRWDIFDEIVKFETLTYSYENAKEEIVEYAYRQFISDHILYKNDAILEQLSSHFAELGVANGDYKTVINHVRLMAGGPDNLLSIKEISPSRKEIKIIPTTEDKIRFEAFCRHKFQIKDVSSLLIQLTNSCPYDQLYRSLKEQNQETINFLQTIFFLPTDGDVLRFLKNLYEDFVRYVALSADDLSAGESPGRVQRIQGIRTYFQNELRSNNDKISSFEEIEQSFKDFTNLRLSEQFAPYSNQTGKNFLDARQFLYDFFVTYFYKAIIDPLEESYSVKYDSYLKNALDFGQNRFSLILNHDFTEENGETILLIKLVQELPNDIKIKDRLWISNLGMIPFVFNTSVRGSVSSNTIRISPPNFFLVNADINVKNINKLYSAEDLRQTDTLRDDQIIIQKKLTELNVDYSSFNNFVVFSSAANRLEVFKAKVVEWTSLSSSLVTLQTYSSSTYPYYTEEVDNIKSQMADVVGSFDGYESYLFNSNNYTYNVTLEEWNSSSYVTEMDDEAATYDRNNADSFINNTPEYIVGDEENDEYLTFLSMTGHYFDNLYLYIKSLPTERLTINQISGSLSVNMLKDMLGSFGWDVDDILSEAAPDTMYLSAQTGGTNTLSDSDRMRSIWNRILMTLPQLYKTKGTEECVRLLLACHGIPTDLITVKEFGGIDYSEGSKVTYVQNEKLFMMHFSASREHWEIPFPQKVKTVEFKVSFDDYRRYSNTEEVPLLWYFPAPHKSGIGQWRLGVRKERGIYDGKVYFRLYESQSYSPTTGPGGSYTELTSSTLPLFNGTVFSVMLRRNYPSSVFTTGSTNTENDIPSKYDLYVQQNDEGRVVFRSTSSVVLSKLYNLGFSDTNANTGSRLYVGNWAASSPVAIGGNFMGLLDKIRLWKVPIDDADFEDHVNDFNSYGWYSSSNDGLLQHNLYFLSDVHYPIDVANPNYITGSSSGSWGSVYFPNANEYYQASQSWYVYGVTFTGSLISSSTNLIAWIPYSSSFRTGSTVFFHNATWQSVSHSLDSGSCLYTTHSVYPYQYVPLNRNQTYPIGMFGPNKFKNQKIKKTTLELSVRLDDRYRSTVSSEKLISADSNIFGFFIDPQDFKNKDSVRYLGQSGILNTISYPVDLYSASYSRLRDVRNQFTRDANRRVLFNELITVNKFYLDKSIFSEVKKVSPARANLLTGVLVEPSIIERPKYQHRPIITDFVADSTLQGVIDSLDDPVGSMLWSDFNTDLSTASIGRMYPGDYYTFVAEKNNNPTVVSPLWYDLLKASGEIVTYKGFEYLLDDYRRILWNESQPPNYTAFLDLEAVNNPNCIRPVNYGNGVICDLPDQYQLGWFGDIAGQARNDSVIVNGVNPLGATRQKSMSDIPSGSAIYYLLKRWRKYDVFAKSGSHVHDENPRDDIYSSASVYLYDLIHVTEDFYKKYVYMSSAETREINDPSTVYEVGYGYRHFGSTFVSTSNDMISNVKAVQIVGGAFTDLQYFHDNSDFAYFELLKGYPRNHYINKSQWLSPSRIVLPLINDTGSAFLKGRQTVNTTIDTGSLNDGTLPIESIEVSDINMVAGDNVLS